MTSPDKDLATTSRDPISSRSPSHRSPKTKNSPSDSHAKSASVYGIPLSATSTILFQEVTEQVSTNFAVPTPSTVTTESTDIKKTWGCVYAGVFCLGIGGFIYGPLLVADIVKDSIVKFSPKNIRDFFEDDEDVTLALRVCSTLLICLATLVASAMCYRIRTGNTRDKSLRWSVLATTVAGLLVGLPVGAISIFVTSAIGAFYIVHFTGRLTSDKDSRRPSPEPLTATATGGTLSRLTTQHTSLSSNITFQPDTIVPVSTRKKKQQKDNFRLEALCGQMAAGIFILATGAVVYGPILITDSAKDSIVNWLPEHLRLFFLERKAITLTLRMFSVSLISIATIIAAYLCYVIMHGKRQARVWRWVVLAKTLVGVLVSLPVSSVGLICTSLLGVSYFVFNAGKVTDPPFFPNSMKASSASFYGVPLATISASYQGSKHDIATLNKKLFSESRSQTI